MPWRSNFGRCIQLLPKRYVRQSLHAAIDRLDVPVGSFATGSRRRPIKPFPVSPDCYRFLRCNQKS